MKACVLGLALLRLVIAGATVCVVLANPARAQQQPQAHQKDLTTASIEDLLNIEVTSASKKPESLSGAPAAIFVITGDDIRRGRFSSVPDALRLAPGLHVAQQSAHVWVVAARGFSSVFNRSMLVLVDGRLVYTPNFGGVWWDVQDPILEDIDRIEVIRGPGGTLWGANAVNGVINIITKEAAKTQGLLVATSAGVNEGYASRVRYGGTVGENLAYRIYGDAYYWLPSVNASGAENFDTWNISQGGTRLDWKTSPRDTLSFDARGYSGRTRDAIDIFSATAPAAKLQASAVIKGGHVLGRWTHVFNDHSLVDVLGYCDWTDRNTERFTEPRNTCDLEFQHSYSFTNRQALTWGGQVVTTAATEQSDFTAHHVPSSERDTIFSLFLQYEIGLVPDKLRLIAGSKFERNSDTGFEYQPQIRAVWTPRKPDTVWVAVSRVVRTPTTAERAVRARIAELSTTPPTFLVLTGSPNVGTEVEKAFEAGYRYEWKSKFSLDATVYYNHFDNLVGNIAGPSVINPSPFYIDVPSIFTNLGSGQTHGLELYLKYTPIPRWTVSTAITELRGVTGPGHIVTPSGSDPRHQVNVQSRVDLTRYLNFDAAYYYYDAIPYTLPPVNRVDVGLSSKVIHGFTFSVWGRNLQSARHQETPAFVLPAGEIRRSVTFKVMWESNRERGNGKH